MPLNQARAVADDAHAAMLAGGRECMDRAFEAVERMGLASRHDLKGFVVVIAARVAFSHGELRFERLNSCPLLFSLSSPGGSRSVRWSADGREISELATTNLPSATMPTSRLSRSTTGKRRTWRSLMQSPGAPSQTRPALRRCLEPGGR